MALSWDAESLRGPQREKEGDPWGAVGVVGWAELGQLGERIPRERKASTDCPTAKSPEEQRPWGREQSIQFADPGHSLEKRQRVDEQRRDPPTFSWLSRDQASGAAPSNQRTGTVVPGVALSRGLELLRGEAARAQELGGSQRKEGLSATEMGG
ncbi:hypothetical protein NDU88_002235 [Pleurodeles waltl]|uniref:Uncharacterized protein n=1 Tax=Pleurodeles waltl TaxID=8319 RepID=A0AAV7SBB8_PLEWA|nr:hypothetical protein NDU88_002235 [Pleurodeles waltl]